MMYNVNKIELGINDVLQLVEILLGEGKLIFHSKSGLKKINIDISKYFNYYLGPKKFQVRFRVRMRFLVTLTVKVKG